MSLVNNGTSNPTQSQDTVQPVFSVTPRGGLILTQAMLDRGLTDAELDWIGERLNFNVLIKALVDGPRERQEGGSK